MNETAERSTFLTTFAAHCRSSVDPRKIANETCGKCRIVKEYYFGLNEFPGKTRKKTFFHINKQGRGGGTLGHVLSKILQLQ